MFITYLLIVLFSTFAFAIGEWQPKQAPLMTPWAENIDPNHVLPEYPRPQMQRSHWTNLNGLWQFQATDSDNNPPFQQNLQDTILVPFPVESALSGIMAKIEQMWYRKLFTYHKKFSNEKVLLHFGAVDWHCKVWLNGNFVGEHKGGYDAFSFEIENYLTEGDNNELIVWVYDPTDYGTQPVGKQVKNPESIWFTSCSGIWQTVWFEQVPYVYLHSIKIDVDIDKSLLTVTPFISDSNAFVSTIVKVSFNGDSITQKSQSGYGALKMTIPQAHLWSPDDPALYDLTVILNNMVGRDDTVKSYFGMRKISLLPDANGMARIALNNRILFNFGPLDQGYWPDGVYTAPSDEALKFDIAYAKKIGFNMIRKHVKVEPARWYYWADKLGMLVWQDMPNMSTKISVNENAKQQYKTELKAIIENLYNHPSIVQWIVFNENWAAFDIPSVVQFVRSLDYTRLINQNSGWNIPDGVGVDSHVGDINDMHWYPGPLCDNPEPHRAIVAGEYGGIWAQVQNHCWTPFTGEGYQDMNAWFQAYSRMNDSLVTLIENKGLSGAVYTELTDVEREYAGLMTFDRKKEKVYYLQLKLSNQNTISAATAIAQKFSAPVVSHFILEQNYPNPFNSITKIKYQIWPDRRDMKAKACFVEIGVYDLLGRVVDTLVAENKAPGTYEVNWNAQDFPSGIYYYQLKINGQHILTKKMILMK